MEEVKAKAKWNKKKKLTDGFSCGPAEGPSLARIGIFVLKKEPHERKYDSFAYTLNQEFTVFQIDRDDLMSTEPLKCDVIAFPGGLCADFELTLGSEGREKVCEFVYNGGGYYGVCAGAFYAGSCNYEGADESKKLLATDLSFHPGLGKAKVKFTKEATEIIDCPNGTEWSMYFSNGCLFDPTVDAQSYLGFQIPKAKVLAHYTHLSTNKMTIDFNNPTSIEDKYTLLQQNKDSFQSISSPMFSHAKHPTIKKINQPVAALCGEYGKGRVLCFGPHPEGTSDTARSIKNCFLWLANCPILREAN